MKHVVLVGLLLLCVTSTLAAVPEAKTFTREDVKTLPKIDPGEIAKRLLYECTFDGPEALKEWKMEGPGVVEVRDGKMVMRSKCQPALLEYWREVAAKRPNREISLDEYFAFVNERFKAQYPDMIDAQGRFEGGHIVNWALKSETPSDYYVEYDFTPVAPVGLYIVFVSTHADGGKSIFDPTLKKRNGVFRGYIKGDIHSYHFSYFANWRGNHRSTCNMRKNSGFFKVASGPDITFVEPGKTHRIGVLKQGVRVRFCIDDRVVIDFTDTGEKGGPAHGGGLVGLRQMIDAEGVYDNFRVYALE